MELENKNLKKLAICDESCTIIGYTNEYCYKLDLSDEVREKCAKLSNKVVEKELTSGRDPKIIAAAIVYITAILSGERKHQPEIAEVAGVTKERIRTRYKEIAEKLGIEVVLAMG